jgi:phosphoribosylformylglycinamidine synthase
MADACRALGVPVTGGNVSFYNETNTRAIYPTPVIGMLGVVESPETSVGIAFKSEGDAIVVLGATDPGDFGGSEYAKVVNKSVAGRPPGLDLAAERRLHHYVIGAINSGLFQSAHDLSEGGLAVGLAESALAGGIGFSVELCGAPHSALFSESPSRAVVSCAAGALDEVLEGAARAGVPAAVVGAVGGDALDFSFFRVTVARARSVFEDAFSSRLSATIP